jgi:protein phosphatase
MSSSGPPPRTRIVVAGQTDVGRQRKHNEDCVLIRPEHDLFVVADGMGGHNAGDVASKLVASSLGNYFEATANGAPIGDLPDEYSRLDPAGKRLAAGVRKANLDVFTISNTHQQHHGMGSTVVGIHIAEGMVHIAHVGDSRCYRVRDGHIQQMTRDHSLINDALDMKPDLTPEELKRLPKNIITRALGMKDVVKVDVKSEPLMVGDVFLLCSDGLTGMVPPEQILEVISLTAEPQEACELLVAEANDAGGNDNISAVLVRIEDALAEPVSAPAVEIAADEQDELGEHDLEEEQHDLEHHEIEHHEVEEQPAVAASTSLYDDEDVSPTLELTADMRVEEVPLLDEEQIADAIAAFSRGDSIDLDLRGPWPGRLAVRRCARCSHELYPGNAFCTECGAKIESMHA